MSIAMSFDQLATVATRLRDAIDALDEADAGLPTDAATYGSDALAAAAATFDAATTRLRRGTVDSTQQLADGVEQARTDMQTLESGLGDVLAKAAGPST